VSISGDVMILPSSKHQHIASLESLENFWVLAYYILFSLDEYSNIDVSIDALLLDLKKVNI